MNKNYYSKFLIILPLLLAGCKKSDEFYEKDIQSSIEAVSSSDSRSSKPGDPNSCNGIMNNMLCKAAPGCEPVYETDESEILPQDEDRLFSQCISTPPKEVVADVPEAGDEPEESDDPSEGIPMNCADIDSEHLIAPKNKKVIICHHAAVRSHSIIVACPALKAHQGHHQDTLGACEEDADE